MGAHVSRCSDTNKVPSKVHNCIRLEDATRLGTLPHVVVNFFGYTVGKKLYCGKVVTGVWYKVEEVFE